MADLEGLESRIREWAARAVAEPVSPAVFDAWTEEVFRHPRIPLPTSPAVDRASITMAGDELHPLIDFDVQQSVTKTMAQAMFGAIDRRRIRVWERPKLRAAVEPRSPYNAFGHEIDHWVIISQDDPTASIMLVLTGKRFYQFMEYKLFGLTMHAKPLPPLLHALSFSEPHRLCDLDRMGARFELRHVNDPDWRAIIEHRLAQRPNYHDDQLTEFAYRYFSEFRPSPFDVD